MAKDTNAPAAQTENKNATAAQPEVKDAPAAQPDAPAAQPQQVIVQVVQPVAVSPEMIPGFAETVPGGRYFVGGRHVDAWGNPLPEGADKQDPHVVAEAVAGNTDLSKLKVK